MRLHCDMNWVPLNCQYKSNTRVMCWCDSMRNTFFIHSRSSILFASAEEREEQKYSIVEGNIKCCTVSEVELPSTIDWLAKWWISLRKVLRDIRGETERRGGGKKEYLVIISVCSIKPQLESTRRRRWEKRWRRTRIVDGVVTARKALANYYHPSKTQQQQPVYPQQEAMVLRSLIPLSKGSAFVGYLTRSVGSLWTIY